MEDESRAESPVLEKRTSTNHCSPLHIILSIIVALAAIGATYYLTISESEEPSEDVLIDDHEPFDDDF